MKNHYFAQTENLYSVISSDVRFLTNKNKMHYYIAYQTMVFTVLNCSVPLQIILHCTVLHSRVLYCIVLYCILHSSDVQIWEDLFAIWTILPNPRLKCHRKHNVGWIALTRTKCTNCFSFPIFWCDIGLFKTVLSHLINKSSRNFIEIRLKCNFVRNHRLIALFVEVMRKIACFFVILLLCCLVSS